MPSKHDPPRFVTEDKFGDVIFELTRRGWIRASSGDPTVTLRWRNLKDISFTRIRPGTFVNHLEGSHNLSNKGKISRLLAVANKGRGLTCFPRCHALATMLASQPGSTPAGSGSTAVAEYALTASVEAMLRDVATQLAVGALLHINTIESTFSQVRNFELLAVCLGVVERWTEQLEKSHQGDQVSSQVGGEPDTHEEGKNGCAQTSEILVSATRCRTGHSSRVPSERVLSVGGSAWRALVFPSQHATLLPTASLSSPYAPHPPSSPTEHQSSSTNESVEEACGRDLAFRKVSRTSPRFISGTEQHECACHGGPRRGAERGRGGQRRTAGLETRDEADEDGTVEALVRCLLGGAPPATALTARSASAAVAAAPTPDAHLSDPSRHHHQKQQQQRSDQQPQPPKQPDHHQQQQQQRGLLRARWREAVAAALARLQRVDPHFELGAEGRGVWIVKPSGASCGDGIVCLRSLPAIATAVAELNFRAVVQKYIERPLLVHGRKFDIRLWVLVTEASERKLVVWAFSDCYLRFSSQLFSLDSLHDRLVHLCNYAVQKDDTGTPPPSAAPSPPTEANAVDPAPEPEGVAPKVTDASTSSSPPPVPPLPFPAPPPPPPPLVQNMLGARAFANHVDAVYGAGAWEALVVDMRGVVLSTLKEGRRALKKHGRGFEWLGFDLMVVEERQRAQQHQQQQQQRPAPSSPSPSPSPPSSSSPPSPSPSSASSSSSSSSPSSPSSSTAHPSVGRLRALLIEVNTSPDVSHSTPVTAALVPVATRDLFTLVLDEGHATTTAPARRQSSSTSSSSSTSTSSSGVGTGRTFKDHRRGSAPAKAATATAEAPEAEVAAAAAARGGAGTPASAARGRAHHPVGRFLSSWPLPSHRCSRAYRLAPDTGDGAATSSNSAAAGGCVGGHEESTSQLLRADTAAACSERAQDQGGGRRAAAPETEPKAAQVKQREPSTETPLGDGPSQLCGILPWADAPGFPPEPTWQLWYAGDCSDLSLEDDDLTAGNNGLGWAPGRTSSKTSPGVAAVSPTADLGGSRAGEEEEEEEAALPGAKAEAEDSGGLVSWVALGSPDDHPCGLPLTRARTLEDLAAFVPELSRPKNGGSAGRPSAAAMKDGPPRAPPSATQRKTGVDHRVASFLEPSPAPPVLSAGGCRPPRAVLPPSSSHSENTNAAAGTPLKTDESDDEL